MQSCLSAQLLLWVQVEAAQQKAAEGAEQQGGPAGYMHPARRKQVGRRGAQGWRGAEGRCGRPWMGLIGQRDLTDCLFCWVWHLLQGIILVDEI